MKPNSVASQILRLIDQKKIMTSQEIARELKIPIKQVYPNIRYAYARGFYKINRSNSKRGLRGGSFTLELSKSGEQNREWALKKINIEQNDE